MMLASVVWSILTGQDVLDSAQRTVLSGENNLGHFAVW